MPAAPRPKLRAAPSKGGSGTREPPQSGTESSAGRSGSSPPASSPRRTPKNDALRVKVERFYMMIGTILIPFGRFIPQIRPIGENLKVFSSEAAQAWMDLAEEDPRVRSYLESWTGASTWGNLIGIHFMIFMSAVPDTSQKIVQSVVDTDDPMAFAKAMGLSDEDIAQAQRMAEAVVSNRPPEPAVQTVREKEHEENQQMISDLKTRGGIVSPSELGIQNDGQAQYSDPMSTGGIK